ncbi:MAG: hypothetical protein EPN23_11340 [Verrucomicrobia bacterium]|nr:MAG: hypothetical protein EPN23_11340 [Verrucomicrobiota bacterium]
MNYAYLPAGQVSSVESVAGTVSYGYDAAERLTQINTPAGTFQYAYDANGRVAAVNGGVKASYGYDALGRVTSIAWKNASGKALRNFAYAYDAAGMITQKVTTANGQATTENYAYDSLNRLTSESSLAAVVPGTQAAVVNYSYDLSGNRTSKQVGAASGTLATVNYTLGQGNRLANWQVAETNPAARLDVAGFSSEPIGTDDRFGQLWVAAGSANKPVVSGTNFWAYGLAVNAGTQQVVAAIRDAAGNVGYATNTVTVNVATNGAYLYNAAGCVTNMAYSGAGFTRNLSLTWNGQYQLTTIATNGVAVEQNGYDALGRRIWTASGGVTNFFVYDGAQVVADVDASGTLLRSYAWGPGVDNLLAMTIHGGPGAPRTVYALKDQLGSIHALVDAGGNIVEQYRFDAWGRTTVYDGNGKLLSESAIGNRYVWQGREISWVTGLYYFRARWYDPVTGRWLSNDPIGISGGLNQYVFCANNPVNFTDPFGLCKEGFWDTTINGHLQALRTLWSWGRDAFNYLTSDEVVAASLAIPPLGMAEEGLVGLRAIAAESEMTSLYRAVSPAEYEQLMKSGTFQAGPNSLGGKFFAESAEHAAEWGTKMDGAGNFKVIEAQFPKSTADSFMRWDRLDGIGPARYGELGPINAANPVIKGAP